MHMSTRRLARIVAITLVFGAGWAGGSLTSRPATAQVPSVGDAMKVVEGQGGALGTAAKLGTTITDMESSVQNLQKGIDSLKTIQKAITG